MPKIRWSRSALEQLELLLQPIAQDDYELAVVIAKRIDNAIHRLSSHPESAPVFSKYLRRLSIPNLPYSCFYEYAGQYVDIVSIRHDKQNTLQ